ncbi:MAG: hypothetical protein CH6_1395 [Candidatus Kapaibacterium sp.]|nr:MAG: hypothetical protein CH6_1395 [Candidatus Kapabacteria bacterium]
MKIKTIIFILISVIMSFNISYSQFFSATKIFEKCSDAVVLIETHYGIGSGFFINENGYVITNHHVVQNHLGETLSPQEIVVKTKNGYTYQVTYVDDTPEFWNLDIAILKVDGTSFNFLPLKPNEAAVGEEVVAIGHPNRDFWNQSKGIISKINLDDQYLLQHDVPTDEGNSGGPLINAKGQVVGVVTAYKWMRDNLGNYKIQETGKLATKASWVKYVLEKRGIKYYQNAIVIEGMSELERQFEDLRKEKEALLKDREQLKIDRENFEREKREFNQFKLDFEKKVRESWDIIQRADILKQELQNIWELNAKKAKELAEREKQIEEKEWKLFEKENELQKRYINRLSLEVLLSPNYLYNLNNDIRYLKFQSSIGLFLLFGFNKDYYGFVKSSDRIGIIYGMQKLFGFETKKFINGYYHDISLAIEFSDIFRFGFGKNFQNNYYYFGHKEYYFAYIKLNLTSYPFPFGLNLGYYTDNDFRLKIFTAGLFFGFNLKFLRL